MIGALKPYAAYKQSGLTWLPEMPMHWATQRSKYLFREVDQRSTDGLEQRLSMSQRHGLIPSSQIEERRLTSESNVGGKLCRPGDLVLNRLKAHLGVIAASPSHGVVSPDYTVLRPLGTANHRYFCAVYRSPYCGQELRRRAKGIVEGFWRLYTDDFYDIRVPLPPPEEQAAIVRFLDWANGRLERTIRAKRKVIALLNEQKQVIVHRAVTRGLDSSVSLKPSGIPWISDIPQHWQMRKIRSLAKTVGGMTPNKSVERFWSGTIPWVSPKDMKVPEIFDAQDHISQSALDETGIALIADQAVLIVVRGMILARTFPTAITRVAVAINQDMKALVPCVDLSVDYFSLLLTGIQRELLQLVEIAGHGTCCLRTDSWSTFSLPIPPLQEQEAIRLHLTSELSTLSAAVSRLEGEIDLLREYQTRLIADIVTGQFDVREAAAHLPAEAPEEPANTEVDLDEDVPDEEALTE